MVNRQFAGFIADRVLPALKLESQSRTSFSDHIARDDVANPVTAQLCVPQGRATIFKRVRKSLQVNGSHLADAFLSWAAPEPQLRRRA